MPIVGDHPETGVRIEVTRALAGGPPWFYRGEAVTRDARFALDATVSAEGAVDVALPREAPDGVAERTRLLLRTAWKHAAEDALPPPRHIVRWRADVDVAPARRGG
jgi:hypothetical protein